MCHSTSLASDPISDILLANGCCVGWEISPNVARIPRIFDAPTASGEFDDPTNFPDRVYQMGDFLPPKYTGSSVYQIWELIISAHNLGFRFQIY